MDCIDLHGNNYLTVDRLDDSIDCPPHQDNYRLKLNPNLTVDPTNRMIANPKKGIT
jgi:hypothetical protein